MLLTSLSSLSSSPQGQRWRQQQQSTGQEKSRTSSSQRFYWEEIHTGPFGTVYRTSRSSSGTPTHQCFRILAKRVLLCCKLLILPTFFSLAKGPSSSYQQAGSGGNNNSFFTFPFGGNLFGTLMGAFSKAMEEAFTSYAHASRSSTQQQRYRQESLSSVPLIHFPRMFKVEEASPFLDALMGAESERALAWEVTSADGEYLGRVDQSKDESKQNDLRYYHPDGLLMVKAKRTWNLDSSRKVYTDDVERHFDKVGHGQVITLTNARNNSLQGKIVEYARFSYNNPLTKWLNGIYSSFIVFNAKNEQEVLLRKWSLGNWGCYVYGLNDKKERIVNFKLPFRPLPWKLAWHFTRAFGEDEIVEEEWKREMRKEKKPSVHPVFYLTLAAFHSLDSKKRSLSHWLATKFGKAK